MPYAEKTDRYGRQLLDTASLLYSRRRMIFIESAITDELAGEVCRQILCLAEESDEDITLVINSPGGSVTAGLAIYDTMTAVDCDIATVCLGMAASMAAFLLAAGTRGKRSCMPNSEVMIHQVMGGASGQAVDVQIAAERIVRMKRTLDSLLAGFTGQDADRIRRDTDRDYFMTAPEAVEYGLVDRIRQKLL